MSGNAGIVADQRYFLRVHLLQQALVLAPNDPDILLALAREYFAAHRWDLALETIDQFLVAARASPAYTQRYSVVARELQSDRTGLLERRSGMHDQLNSVLKDQSALEQNSPDIIDIASGLRRQGFPLRALQLLDENKLELSGNMLGQVEYGILLIECGRLEEASGVVSTFDSFPDSSGLPFDWTLHAAWLDQARGDVASAIVRCQRKLRNTESNSIQALLAVAPFVHPMPQLTGDGNTWPVSQAVVTGRVFVARDEAALLRWTIASAYLESGQCKQAAEALQILLETEPETALRPLAALYLELLTGESVPYDPPTQQVPILFLDGPEDPEPPVPASDKANGDDVPVSVQ